MFADNSTRRYCSFMDETADHLLFDCQRLVKVRISILGSMEIVDRLLPTEEIVDRMRQFDRALVLQVESPEINDKKGGGSAKSPISVADATWSLWPTPYDDDDDEPFRVCKHILTSPKTSYYGLVPRFFCFFKTKFPC
jgi:hypothetical protein